MINLTFDDLWQSLRPRCIVGNSSGLFLSSFANTSQNKLPAFLIERDHNMIVFFPLRLTIGNWHQFPVVAVVLSTVIVLKHRLYEHDVSPKTSITNTCITYGSVIKVTVAFELRRAMTFCAVKFINMTSYFYINNILCLISLSIWSTFFSKQLQDTVLYRWQWLDVKVQMFVLKSSLFYGVRSSHLFLQDPFSLL